MKTRLYNFSTYILCLLFYFGVCSANAQVYDIGAPAMSTLKWKEISSWFAAYHGMGLTTDKRLYVWGNNSGFTINTNKAQNGQAKYQVAPFYMKLPNGDLGKKVRLRSMNLGGGFPTCMFYTLAESGTLYAWGYNDGLAPGAWNAYPAGPPNLTDTTFARRTPVALSALGESKFVDFDTPIEQTWWVAVGESGEAYHIGRIYPGTINTTFSKIPKPTGVGASFKYTNVWAFDEAYPMMYLKGNDGKIYYAGFFTNAYSSGVPGLYARNTPAPTLTTAEQSNNILTYPPREVPFPAGEDIVSMHLSSIQNGGQAANFALSASGKAYAAGLWRVTGTQGYLTNENTFVIVPLKSTPADVDVDKWKYNSGQIDTLVILKRFYEVAMPSGASKILDIEAISPNSLPPTLVVGDNNKVYWSGGVKNNNSMYYTVGNYLSATSAERFQPDDCSNILPARTNSWYSWQYESYTFDGSASIERTYFNNQISLISKNGVGYFQGTIGVNMGIGKHFTGGWTSTAFPVPIANELLLDCNTSPGTGGASVPASASGIIDCSKTQLAPAPVQGTPGQTGLIVTVTVSATGTFPLSVTGSGMSLANGVTYVTATSTGVQQFYIPLQYDGSALGTLNFTVGTASNAGSCAADLSGPPKQAITNIWTLDCVPMVGPPLK